MNAAEITAYCRARPALATGWPICEAAPVLYRRVLIGEARIYESLGLVTNVSSYTDNRLGECASFSITELGHAVAAELRQV